MALGTGMLKPNVSAMVGQLYTQEDHRRDAGFSVFYMGINTGAFFGPLLCGYLGEKVDRHLGFGIAGFGMIIGLVQYKLGAGYLGSAGLESTNPEYLAEKSKNWTRLSPAWARWSAPRWCSTCFGQPRPHHGKVAQLMGYVIGGIGVVYFIYVLLFGQLTPAERNRVIVIFLLFIGAAMF